MSTSSSSPIAAAPGSPEPQATSTSLRPAEPSTGSAQPSVGSAIALAPEPMAIRGAAPIAFGGGAGALNPELVRAISQAASMVVPAFERIMAAAPSGRPGWKTTEFWLALLVAASLLYSSIVHLVPQELGMVLGVSICAGYIALRSVYKSRASMDAAVQAVRLAAAGGTQVAVLAPIAAQPDAADTDSLPPTAAGAPTHSAPAVNDALGAGWLDPTTGTTPPADSTPEAAATHI